MKPEDQERFIQSMGIMAEAFQKKPSENMAEIYWRVLQDMSIGNFEQACLNLINTRKITGTFPMVAEIREASGAGESLDTRIALAWDKLIFAIENHGYYDSVQFDDPVIHLIVKSWGGWIAVGDHDGEIANQDLKWTKKEFEKLYRAYAPTNLQIRDEDDVHSILISNFPQGKTQAVEWVYPWIFKTVK